ncbi:hypothetical protein Drorol1_Dr00000591 [Drosera rotundifolia]
MKTSHTGSRYLAPEYAASGKLTENFDVFSFGVMFFELITGRCPVDPTGDEDSLVDWSTKTQTKQQPRFKNICKHHLRTAQQLLTAGFGLPLLFPLPHRTRSSYEDELGIDDGKRGIERERTEMEAPTNSWESEEAQR